MLEKVKKLTINDDRYFPVVLSLDQGEWGKSIGIFGRAHSLISRDNQQEMKIPKMIFVKKKFNKLSNEEDPLGIKMFSSKPFSYLPNYQYSQFV